MHQLVQKYMLLVEKISNTTRQSQTFGTDVDIYRSEIHIIQLLGDNGALSISEIGRLIGITRGTVSQIIKRLEKKGLVVKQVDAANNTRIQVSLTEKGQVACDAHARFHEEQHREMEAFLAGLDSGQVEVLLQFLQHAEEMIEEHL